MFKDELSVAHFASSETVDCLSLMIATLLCVLNNVATEQQQKQKQHQSQRKKITTLDNNRRVRLKVGK